MTKFKTEIKMANGKCKRITVYIEDRTAELLNQCDECVRQIYLEEEYKAQNLERAETRRHISLEKSVETGCEYQFEGDDPLNKLLRKERENELKTALDKLTDKQQQVFMLYVIEGLSFEEVGSRMGISWQGAQFHFYAAQKKLKEFLKKYL